MLETNKSQQAVGTYMNPCSCSNFLAPMKPKIEKSSLNENSSGLKGLDEKKKNIYLIARSSRL